MNETNVREQLSTYVIVVYFTGFSKSTQADTYHWPFHTDNKGKDMYSFDKPCI